MDVFKNCGEVRMGKLESKASITKVNQLIFANLTQKEIESKPTPISKITSIVLSYIQGYHQQAKTTTPGHAPTVINHLDTNDPYLSKYIED